MDTAAPKERERERERERETKREIEGGRERCGRREILENYISAARSKKDEIVFKRKLG
jgi:hypothetical protein